MFKIYDGKIYIVQEGTMNRNEKLNFFSSNEAVSTDDKIVIYDEDCRIKRVETYKDILNFRNVPNVVLRHSKNVFHDAFGIIWGIQREMEMTDTDSRFAIYDLLDNDQYFTRVLKQWRGEDYEGISFAVLGDHDELLYILEFHNNKYVLNEIFKIMGIEHVFLDYEYSVEDKRIDLNILDRADIYVFDEFNEYTYALSEIINKYLSGRQIIFLDKKARYFYLDHMIMERTKLKYFVVQEREKRFMYVSKRTMDFGIGGYEGRSLFHSVFWIQMFANQPLNDIKQVVVDYGITFTDGLMPQLYEYTRLSYYAKRRNMQLFSKDANFKFYSIDLLNKYFCLDIKKESEVNMNVGKLVINLFIRLGFLSCLSIYEDADSHFKSIIRKSFMEQLEKDTLRILPRNKRILGVNVRGTDYTMLMPIGHGVQANASQIINRAKSMMALDKYDYIFLSTEEQEAFNEFQTQFGETLLYFPRRRVSGESCKKERKLIVDLVEKDYMEQNLVDYMTETYILSKCTSLLSSGVNTGFRVAVAMNEEKYEDVYVYKSGLYQ